MSTSELMPFRSLHHVPHALTLALRQRKGA